MLNIRYFGIKTPKNKNESGYIWWISNTEHDAWTSFFTFPSRDRTVNPYRTPLADAIRAYEAIGYKCIELDVTEKGTTYA